MNMPFFKHIFYSPINNYGSANLDNKSKKEKFKRNFVFLFPQEKMNNGGHLAQEKFFELLHKNFPSIKMTYEKKYVHIPYLKDYLKNIPKNEDNNIYCLHYGPHIHSLCRQLKGRKIVYFAHSTGWNFKLPEHIPVVAVSRHSLSFWASQKENRACYYLPNIISDEFCCNDLHMQNRENDIVVVKRKMSDYLLHQLIPVLQQHCTVKIIDSWVKDLSFEFKRSKVMLYDSKQHWSKAGVSEGFGLPPLEALASGCSVFSSLNGALSDYLEPSVNCYQLGVKDVDFDVERILTAVKCWSPLKCVGEDPAALYRETYLNTQMVKIFSEIQAIFA